MCVEKNVPRIRGSVNIPLIIAMILHNVTNHNIIFNKTMFGSNKKQKEKEVILVLSINHIQIRLPGHWCQSEQSRDNICTRKSFRIQTISKIAIKSYHILGLHSKNFGIRQSIQASIEGIFIDLQVRTLLSTHTDFIVNSERILLYYPHFNRTAAKEKQSSLGRSLYL